METIGWYGFETVMPKNYVGEFESFPMKRTTCQIKWKCYRTVIVHSNDNVTETRIINSLRLVIWYNDNIRPEGRAMLASNSSVGWVTVDRAEGTPLALFVCTLLIVNRSHKWSCGQGLCRKGWRLLMPPTKGKMHIFWCIFSSTR
jgi:hypothetical protein